MGMNIYKYAMNSEDTLNFNLLYQEYLNGKCVDSSRIVSDDVINKVNNMFHQSLIITKDTNFLEVFVQNKSDSIYSIKSVYSFFGLGSMQKEIVVPYAKFGKHELREFASPKISNKGCYPILMLGVSWKQNINGQSVQRFCYPESIEQIKVLIPHFYVFSVIAY